MSAHYPLHDRNPTPRPFLRSVIRRGLLDPFERTLPARYRLPFEVWKLRFRRQLEEEFLMLPRLVGNAELALDVGANFGYYSYGLSRICRWVEAFEPNPEILHALWDMAAPNVRVHNLALSSHAGEMDLYVPSVDGVAYPGWASFDSQNLPGAATHHVLHVPVAPLDDLGFRGVSFIKIDVEGHEVAVLRGAARTIESSRPTVLAESKPVSRGEVFDFFLSRDYCPYRVFRRRLVPVHSLADPGAISDNFVFIPRERSPA